MNDFKTDQASWRIWRDIDADAAPASQTQGTPLRTHHEAFDRRLQDDVQATRLCAPTDLAARAVRQIQNQRSLITTCDKQANASAMRSRFAASVAAAALIGVAILTQAATSPARPIMNTAHVVHAPTASLPATLDQRPSPLQRLREAGASAPRLIDLKKTPPVREVRRLMHDAHKALLYLRTAMPQRPRPARAD